MFNIPYRTLVLRPKLIWNFSEPSSVLVRGVANGTKPKRSRFTDAEDQLILELRREANSYEKIGRLVDRSGKSVRARIRDYLQYRDPSDRPFSECSYTKPADKELNLKILSWVDNEGLSYATISRRLGCCINTVRRRYTAVCLSGKRNRGDGSAPYSEQENEVIASGIRQNQTVLEIAHHLNVLPERLGSKRTSIGVQRHIRATEHLRALKRSVEIEDAVQLRQDVTFTVDSDSPKSTEAGSVRCGDASPTTSCREKRKPFPRRNNTRWSTEDVSLLLARPEGEKLDWDELAGQFFGRTPDGVRNKYQSLRPRIANRTRKGYPRPASARS